MPKPREIAEVTALVGVRVARGLHTRWRRLSAAQREPLGPLAREAKQRALDLRGSIDPRGAEARLREANARLADAMVDSASADPEVSERDVRRLREELTRELERISQADVRAAPGPGHERRELARPPARG